ncbi:hypothetical protein BV20DRAFT_131632 [Pilatotrama ljubarskyi]|nr:hypothetical protein BV20DRAFT_131632 [Pilatotrama ljubarskyi]
MPRPMLRRLECLHKRAEGQTRTLRTVAELDSALLAMTFAAAARIGLLLTRRGGRGGHENDGSLLDFSGENAPREVAAAGSLICGPGIIAVGGLRRHQWCVPFCDTSESIRIRREREGRRRPPAILGCPNETIVAPNTGILLQSAIERPVREPLPSPVHLCCQT